ncbi:MAG: integrase arm-type DNA-binding domain-containing protein, partial [Deltaproteobacteria bacterium]|nr:integrase arm-type DNA-binding domain-containing protein [Deltaproteobacteria bacterium]
MLTYNEIKNSQPRDKAYKLYDGGGLGLYLEVKPAGSRLWRLQYTFRGRRLLKSLGAFPDVSLSDARAEAAAFKKTLADGTDPFPKDKRPAETFRQLAIEWADKFLPGLAAKTRRKNLTNLEKKILPYLGDLRPDEIKPAIVLSEVLRPIEAQGHIETLHRVKTLLSQIFRYAVANGLMERDFTLDLRG